MSQDHYSSDFSYLAETINSSGSSALTEAEAQLVTYGMYCESLDRIAAGWTPHASFYASRLDEGILDVIKQSGLAQKLGKVFVEFKDTIGQISSEFKIGAGEIVGALKQKDAFTFLKAIRFNLGLALKSVQAATKLVRKGLLSVFKELHKTGVWQKVRSGAMKIDEVLDRYPILKQVTGIVVAGLLIYIWLNMTFIGDLEFDMDLSTVALALAGSFSITDMFTSPAGMMMLTLLGTGFIGLSFPWLGASAYNMLVALIYTLLRQRKNRAAANLKSALELKSI